jgi:hypothetical protein
MLRREGLAEFCKRIDHYADMGMPADEVHDFKQWARDYTAQRERFWPTPAAQQAWLAETRARLETLRQRRVSNAATRQRNTDTAHAL